MTDKPSACGTCVMCCKHLGVEEIDKPAHKWCPHCAVGAGCQIYATRPPSCQQYECVWLTLHNDGKDPPVSLRPDRCKVIIDVQENELWYIARVSSQYRDHWRKPNVMLVLQTIVDTIPGSAVFLVVDGGNARPVVYKTRPKPLEAGNLK